MPRPWLVDTASWLASKSHYVNRVTRYLTRCAAIAACTLLLSHTVCGYTRVGSGWPQPDGPDSAITLTYSYQNMFDGGLLMPNGQPLPYLLIRDSVEEALGLWASVAPLHFVEVEDFGLPYGFGNTKYGTIRLRHVYINGPDPPPPAQPVAKAQAYYPSSGGRSAGDIEYDHGDRWQEIGTLPHPDILGATVHELGHSLGLGHSDDDDANMYWIFNRSTGLGTALLDQDDIDGIQSIYGAGIGSVTPLVGSWADRAIEPAHSHRLDYDFTNVPTNRWVESPLGPRITFTADSGTLFSGIAALPTGFGSSFTVSVGDTIVGNFAAGANVGFQSFPGGGVNGFEISANDPLVSQPGSSGFPLRLTFTSPTGSFAASAVPEPAAYAVLHLTMLSLAGSRRPRAFIRDR